MIVIESMLMDLAVQALNANDKLVGLTPRESLLIRILKACEERGEAAAAVVGWTGQNPRKGLTHTEADVVGELADVVLTAMLAMASMTDEWQTIISTTYRTKLRRLVDSVGTRPDMMDMTADGMRDTEAASTEGMRNRRENVPYMSAYDMRGEIQRLVDWASDERLKPGSDSLMDTLILSNILVRLHRLGIADVR